MARPRHILILGGTGDAARLAHLAVEAFGADAVTTSLAGVTREPAPLPGRVRTGGFGGAEGLAAYLKEHAVDRLVDATHPFAATISAHAVEAAADTGVPRLVLSRPPWRRQPTDRWIEVDDMHEARYALDDQANVVFLAVGRKELAQFKDLWGFRFHIRLVEEPDRVLPVNDYSLTIARGPFTIEGETELFQREKIRTVVAKASGGESGYAKIAAARALGLPVILVRRPADPPGPAAATPEDALAWLQGTP
jgi:precorrin-6A/cobalt-precorrin-6A reductase